MQKRFRRICIKRRLKLLSRWSFSFSERGDNFDYDFYVVEAKVVKYSSGIYGRSFAWLAMEYISGIAGKLQEHPFPLSNAIPLSSLQNILRCYGVILMFLAK